MEVYTLDSVLRRTRVVDTFETCIWTERLSAFGDFELNIFSTFAMRSLLTAGTRLAITESNRVMTIETVEDTLDSEGKTMLKITGRSLEALLLERINRHGLASGISGAKWRLVGTPANIVRQIFDTICRTNTAQPGDNIPFLVAGSLYPKSTITEPEDIITVYLEFGSVYESIKDICEAYSLGFRIVRNMDKSQLMFDVYSGNDHTTLQSILPPVVFSPELDNLTDVSELTSIDSYRNIAYVFSPVESTIVYVDGADANTSGFQRRVLLVDASDITYPERAKTLTNGQETAINKAIGLDNALAAEKDALNRLVRQERLWSVDPGKINTVVTRNTWVGTEVADIYAARDASLALNADETTAMIVTLKQRGTVELAKWRSISAFDGEIPQTGSYRYTQHYELGDLVEMRNQDGVTNNMRVTEQIFVSDTAGDRSYPTLAIDLFITPGSWFAWDYNQVWENVVGTWVEA